MDKKQIFEKIGEINKQMKKLSGSLTAWPHIKRQAMALKEKPQEELTKCQIGTLKKYESLFPIQQEVKDLKAQKIGPTFQDRLS